MARARDLRAPETAHIPALDGVRGLAIALVMLHHFATGMNSRVPAFRAFFGLAETGWVGVDLFFALSGYLITGILFDAKAAPRHYFRNFYMRRALRIVPLYYATLALAILPTAGPLARSEALGLRTIRGEQAWYWLYGVNLLQAMRGRFYPLGNYWTLSVEEHFYLLWPIAAFLLSRRALMACAAALFAIALATRLGMIAAHANPIAIYVLTPCRMDTLAAGAFVALAARGPGGLAAVLPGAAGAGDLRRPAAGPLREARRPGLVDPGLPLDRRHPDGHRLGRAGRPGRLAAPRPPHPRGVHREAATGPGQIQLRPLHDPLPPLADAPRIPARPPCRRPQPRRIPVRPGLHRDGDGPVLRRLLAELAPLRAAIPGVEGVFRGEGASSRHPGPVKVLTPPTGFP